MIEPAYALIELIRRLEERRYVFSADPHPITESLKIEAGDWTDKLRLRAERIDADGHLRRTLDKVDARIHTAVKLIMLFWLVSGFMTAMALMHADAVNFFYVLVSVLGINWLMLLLWLFWLLMSKGQSARKQGAWFNPLSFISSKDTLTQSAVDVYEAHLHQPNMRWYWGKVSHQFWLATLTGLFAGITLMLTIRQYTFNWQSTLLDSHMLAKLVGWLSWLPNKLGISTVDAQTVAHNQTVGQIADARQWAILLMLSLLLYGIVPRVIAWLICHLRLSTKSPDLPLALPYYQRLQRLWTPAHVIDADTLREQIGTHTRPNIVADAFAIAAVLESPQYAADATWSQNLLNRDWYHWGNLDGRTDTDKLLAEMAQHPVALLLGVRAQTVPERGTLRLLETLAQKAQGGLWVYLLSDDKAADGGDPLRERQKLWQTALTPLNIPLHIPPTSTESEQT
mgnify:FL=1